MIETTAEGRKLYRCSPLRITNQGRTWFVYHRRGQCDTPTQRGERVLSMHDSLAAAMRYVRSYCIDR